VETVFLLAATGPEQASQERNLIEAAQAAGVRRVVKLSVWRADEQLTPIARLHRRGRRRWSRPAWPGLSCDRTFTCRTSCGS
jgi:uncharacterized protein YbjT (DUF2867 family)